MGQIETTIMDEVELNRTIERISREIMENLLDPEKFMLIGIVTRGVILANRIKALIAPQISYDIPVGTLDITLYRDDWTRIYPYPIVRSTVIPCSLEDKHIVLVDDVLYTGRTVRAALDAVLDYGRPHLVHLAVLVDRGHRELPICAQYTGMKISTKRQEHVHVHLKEMDGLDRVILRSL